MVSMIGTPIYLSEKGEWLTEFWTRKKDHPEHDCGCGEKEGCPRIHLLIKYEKPEPWVLSWWEKVKGFLFGG
jgi:hypothetical protein